MAVRLPGLSDAHHTALCDELARSTAELAEGEEDRAEAALKHRLGLSHSEMRVVMFLAAVAESPETAGLVMRLAPNGMTTEALRKLVFGDAGNVHAFRELSGAGRLRKLGLITRNDGGTDELHDSRQTWTVSDRVLAWLYGDESIDASCDRFAKPSGAVPLERLSTHPDVLAKATQAMKAATTVVIASGAPGLGRRSLLAAAAKEAGIELLEIDAKHLARSAGELTKQLRMIARECRLLAMAPLIRNIDALVEDKDTSKIDLVGSELVAELSSNVFVTCGVQRPQIRWERPMIVIDVKPPSSAQRATLWMTLLDACETDGEYLATTYPLAPAIMHAAAAATKARAVGRKLTPEHVELGIRAVLDDKLGNFAKRVDVTQSWDDLVIDREQAQSITELIARIRQRRTVYEQWGFASKVGKGLGVSALFSGPPGTGKTMVAALIAKELHLELYQVDMGKLVSKYIGETEKQLGEMFDAAEAGHAILLFDEADSMFGKRTDVKSSNDRYANLETNYLLQRLESFTGICLLTSNHESNIDPAFQRRLSLHLRFEVPDEDERAKLWLAMLPDAAPVAPNLDVAGLARRFEMSGGYIRNAALRAAFLAADEGTPIGEAHLEHAARLEYEGMGKIVTPRAPQWPSRLSSSL
jgi:SpoVK/Ycf46/Vps4 family AAA+-type ATPase